MLTRAKCSWSGLAACAMLLGLSVGSQAADPSADEIMKRVIDGNAGVSDYTAQVKMEADMQVAPAEVPEYKVYFKRPDKVYIESRSIVVARKDMFTFGSLARRVDEGTVAHFLGKKIENGVPLYSIKLVPTDAAHEERVLLRVDGQRWTVSTIELTDGQTTFAKLIWEYALVGGTFWMPTSIRAEIPAAQGRDGTPGASITVSFSDYTVNTGLSDDIFKQDE